METRILSILTRTPLHVGAGASVGAIDLPIQRERHTQIPIVPGSSLKGVLRDLWNDDKETQEILFGSETTADTLRAGELLVGEARAVCFPVRSAQGSFAWLSSPLALKRYMRDSGLSDDYTVPSPNDDSAFAGSGVLLKGKRAVILEEFCFKAEPIDEKLPMSFDRFLPGDALLGTLKDRFVLVSDGIYSHFCANACEVQQRVRIDDERHVVQRGGLFNQENAPSETLFYAVIGTRVAGPHIEKLEAKLNEVGGILQVGGDETVGLGFCSVHLQGGIQ